MTDYLLTVVEWRSFVTHCALYIPKLAVRWRYLVLEFLLGDGVWQLLSISLFLGGRCNSMFDFGRNVFKY